MPKYSTYPTLFDEVLKIDSFFLMHEKSIKSGVHLNGSLTWSRRGEKFASISYQVNMRPPNSYILLDYKFNGEPRSYKVQIVSIPSNLGAGEIYYFKCPETGKSCRYLYQIGGWFLHREAFKSVLYEKQTYSKRMRDADRFFGGYYLADKAYEEINSKHFKKFYGGKPTKRYKRLLNQIKYSAQFTHEDFKRFWY
jgi:hypothetical protein